MPLITLRTLLDHAQKHNYGVPSFNFQSIEQLQAIMRAADKEKSPVILQVSAGGRKYATNSMLKKMVEATLLSYPYIPLVWHQDHAHVPEECMASIKQGYTSVMMDGSLTAAGDVRSLEENIAVTRQVVDIAHAVGVSVEGEIGCLGRIGENVKNTEVYVTDVDEAVRFVEATQVDALAIAIGTSHGAYKFDAPPNAHVLALPRLQALHKALPAVHFVLHGSSSVPQNYLEMIREYGGDIPKTYGVPLEDMAMAVQWGVRKFNIDTDLRIVAIAIMRRTLAEKSTLLDPRVLHKEIISAQSQLIQERYQILRSSGQAPHLMQDIAKGDVCLL